MRKLLGDVQTSYEYVNRRARVPVTLQYHDSFIHSHQSTIDSILDSIRFAIRLWKIRKDHQIDNNLDIANEFIIGGGGDGNGGGGGGNSGSGINKDIKFAIEDRIELYDKT